MKSKSKNPLPSSFRAMILESSDVGPEKKEPIRYEMQNVAEISRVSIVDIASIAAQLVPPWESPVERVRQAFSLLDAAAAGKKGLLQKGSVEKGFKDFVFQRDGYREYQEMLAEAKDDPLLHTNSEGEKVADFEGVMKSFFGVGQDKTRAERLERLLCFIQETSMNPETQKKGISWEKAEACLADWQAKGISELCYCWLRRYFANWWEYHVRRTNSANASVPKGKQGRVKRRDDKRRGARTPRLVDELKKK
jgi:hypothetical protein